MGGAGHGGIPAEDGSLILRALGAAIREHRLQAGLTQAELAQRAGIGRPHLNHIEGGRKNPTVVVLVHLAAVSAWILQLLLPLLLSQAAR